MWNVKFEKVPAELQQKYCIGVTLVALSAGGEELVFVNLRGEGILARIAEFVECGAVRCEYVPRGKNEEEIRTR